MHPRTLEFLEDLVGMADRALRAGKASGREADLALARDLVERGEDLRNKPSEDGERYVDDATVWLAQALRNAEAQGLFGNAGKWLALAQVLVPFARTDLARALDRSHRISTTEQGR